MVGKKLFGIFNDSSGTFEGQGAGEEIILLLRQHPFYIILRVVVFGILCLVPIVLGVTFYQFLSTRGFVSAFFLISSLWYILLWTSLFYSLAMYSLNTVIITRERLIENEQLGFFSRRVSELHMHRVQDISAQTHGVIETVLHFGNLVVQSAGMEKQFVLHSIPHPERVKNEIMKLVSAKRATPTAI